jgi:class 3 adenylate cyclase
VSEPIRKLAAIVFTDIVGFTELTAEDQSKASALFRQQRELLGPMVEFHIGSWIKNMGDVIL